MCCICCLSCCLNCSASNKVAPAISLFTNPSCSLRCLLTLLFSDSPGVVAHWLGTQQGIDHYHYLLWSRSEDIEVIGKMMDEGKVKVHVDKVRLCVMQALLLEIVVLSAA